MIKCDDKLGVCTSDELEIINKKELDFKNPTLFYIGDPMCSWCFGMSDILKQTQEYCTTNSIKFEIVLAGLRAGGGDYWDIEFKTFLKNEWSKISKVTSKKFSFDLFELDYFNYDTRPACKAVFIAKRLLKDKNDNNKLALEFFSQVQENFYAKSKDPKELEFYKDICEKLNLSFDEFSKLFNSDDISKKLEEEFNYSKSFSRSMPSLVLINQNKKIDISIGYSLFEELVLRINQSIKSL